MDWPDKLNHDDMILFLKEATLTGYDINFSKYGGINPKKDVKVDLISMVDPLTIETLEESLFSSVELWERGDLMKRYWFHHEKEYWTWGRRPWA